MGRALALLRSRAVRVGFVVVALGLATYAVVRERAAVATALAEMPATALLGALGTGVVYLVLTMLAWRAVLTDLGSRLPVAAGARVFFLSQLGKYVPGGVWNLVAAGELGAGHEIPRRRSLSAMAVTVLVSVITGMAVAGVAVVLGPAEVAERYGWVVWSVPVLVVLMTPWALNRVLALLLRLARRPPLEHPLTARGAGAATGWSVAAWVVAGAQVWLLATAVGMPATGGTFALAVGGYALAWVVGFLVVVAPAGLGVREAVLLVTLAGQLDDGGVLTVVLMSRLVLTVVDGLAGLAAMVPVRRARVAR